MQNSKNSVHGWKRMCSLYRSTFQCSKWGLKKDANPNYDPVYLQKLQPHKIPSSEPTEADNVDFDSSGLIDFIPCWFWFVWFWFVWFVWIVSILVRQQRIMLRKIPTVGWEKKYLTAKSQSKHNDYVVFVHYLLINAFQWLFC